MREYKPYQTEQPLKYLLAAILFCVVLGWAFTDACGSTVRQNVQTDCIESCIGN